MVARIFSIGLWGLEGFPVTIEADVLKGMPSFDIVGLPDASVRESRDRIRSALGSLGYELPLGRITVNLAPADIKKAGALYDAAILLAILQASGQLSMPPLSDAVFLGEISLSGELRPVNGTLPMVIQAKQAGFRRAFVPHGNREEAAVVDGMAVYAPQTVDGLLLHLLGKKPLPIVQAPADGIQKAVQALDFQDVKGQEGARRALEIAAAGGHNALLIGPPGSGKSMLAKRLPSILPSMTLEESIETTKIHSVAGALSGTALIRTRPFRAPHHTVSVSGLAGGGAAIKPGELSLAHNGVLFLDELPEFHRDAIEVLRQPMEDGFVTISRVKGSLTYPCSVMVVAAMNPCPCGYFGHPTRPCTCSPAKTRAYLSRVSGPLLDRMDLHVEVAPVEYDQLASQTPSESSQAVRERVAAARKRQQERLGKLRVSCNAKIPSAHLNACCPMTDSADHLLKLSFERLGLSGRAYDRILKVARTIADLDSSDTISREHVAEAIQYRSLDRKYWGLE